MRLQNGDRQRTALVRYHRGVYQSDAQSPLLFCLSIIPVSKALTQFSGVKVGLGASTSTTHLLYMDDLKVYAERHEELLKMIGVVQRVGEAVGMAMGLGKCAWTRASQRSAMVPDSLNETLWLACRTRSPTSTWV